MQTDFGDEELCSKIPLDEESESYIVNVSSSKNYLLCLRNSEDESESPYINVFNLFSNSPEASSHIGEIKYDAKAQKENARRNRTE